MNDVLLTKSGKCILTELMESINNMDDNSEMPFILLARVYKTGRQNGYRQGFIAGVASRDKKDLKQ